MKVVASPLRKKPTPEVPEFNQWRLADEVEEGFETANQVAAKVGKDVCHVARTLKKMLADGKVEMKAYRVSWAGTPIKHYRTINYAEAKKHQQNQEHCRHR